MSAKKNTTAKTAPKSTNAKTTKAPAKKAAKKVAAVETPEATETTPVAPSPAPAPVAKVPGKKGKKPNPAWNSVVINPDGSTTIQDIVKQLGENGFKTTYGNVYLKLQREGKLNQISMNTGKYDAAFASIEMRDGMSVQDVVKALKEKGIETSYSYVYQKLSKAGLLTPRQKQQVMLSAPVAQTPEISVSE